MSSVSGKMIEPLVYEKKSGVNYRTRWGVWSVVCIAFIGTLYAALTRGGAVEWYVLTVLAGLFVFSGLLPIVATWGIAVNRSLSCMEAKEGQDAQVSLTFKRYWRIPFVWIAIDDSERNESEIGERSVHFRDVQVPLFSKELTIDYSLHSLTRGVHRFSPIKVIIGDWLGLTAIKCTIMSEKEIVVLPALPREQLPMATKVIGSDGQVSGYARQPYESIRSSGEKGLVDSSLSWASAGGGPDSRPYRDGDPLRNLDFRAAARGRGLFTKVFSGDDVSETFIIIDQHGDAYKGDNRLFDACISWSLLGTKSSLERGNAVTVITNNWSYELGRNSNGDHRVNMNEIMNLLAYLRADGNHSMAEKMKEACDKLAKGGMLKLFSPAWQDAGGWLTLASYASERSIRIELYFLVRGTVATFAMREQGRILDGSGIKVKWLSMSEGYETTASSEEGVSNYAFG
ncbi:DUF58 domain-containing protein [Paenibacillus sp. GSMTC-2017]|uniref:DUF58 domain-containing protein n=1 Tax=Paenibacillus sp. GSMTC-2017 TaxID=2794350 RepID=UPI0018D6908B|nr:DUF58 domain-containing protein [Paenibacillus sp. GSMTC-2017]MBH5318970.1 DUF58 domain-containing protein [Paenibacillus sp. GSMTC-2017]